MLIKKLTLVLIDNYWIQNILVVHIFPKGVWSKQIVCTINNVRFDPSNMHQHAKSNVVYEIILIWNANL